MQRHCHNKIFKGVAHGEHGQLFVIFPSSSVYLWLLWIQIATVLTCCQRPSTTRLVAKDQSVIIDTRRLISFAVLDPVSYSFSPSHSSLTLVHALCLSVSLSLPLPIARLEIVEKKLLSIPCTNLFSPRDFIFNIAQRDRRIEVEREWERREMYLSGKWE